MGTILDLLDILSTPTVDRIMWDEKPDLPESDFEKVLWKDEEGNTERITYEETDFSLKRRINETLKVINDKSNEALKKQD